MTSLSVTGTACSLPSPLADDEPSRRSAGMAARCAPGSIRKEYPLHHGVPLGCLSGNPSPSDLSVSLPPTAPLQNSFGRTSKRAIGPLVFVDTFEVVGHLGVFRPVGMAVERPLMRRVAVVAHRRDGLPDDDFLTRRDRLRSCDGRIAGQSDRAPDQYDCDSQCFHLSPTIAPFYGVRRKVEVLLTLPA